MGEHGSTPVADRKFRDRRNGPGISHQFPRLIIADGNVPGIGTGCRPVAGGLPIRDRELSPGDGRAVRFKVPSGDKKQAGPISAPVLSAIDGHPHLGYVTQSYGRVAYKPGGGQLELGENHSVSEELRTPGLPSKLLLAIWNGHLEFEMSAPIRIKHEHSSTNSLYMPPR